MSTPIAPADPLSERPDHSRLWYADPTGQAAVRNIMDVSRADDFCVVDSRGNVIFRIKPNVLAGLLPYLNFTKTRRGRSAIRAHKRNALETVAAAEGSNQNPTLTKESDVPHSTIDR